MEITIVLECEVDGEYKDAEHEALLNDAIANIVPPSFPIEDDVCIVIVRKIAVGISEETP